MTGLDVGVSEVGATPRRSRHTRLLSLTVADRLLGAYAVCTSIPLLGLAIMWIANVPVTDPTTPYPYALVLAFLVGFLFFSMRLRDHLKRIEQLQRKARTVRARVSGNTPVAEVHGDELDDLASSFDQLANGVYEQVRALTVTHELDRAVLSTLDTHEIVEIVLGHVSDIVPCDAIVVAIGPRPEQPNIWSVRGCTVSQTLMADEVIEPSPEEVKELWGCGRSLHLDTTAGARRSYVTLPALTNAGVRLYDVFPLFHDGAILGVLSLGFRQSADPTPNQHAQLRRLIDQLTVALSNARLVEEVNELNHGTVGALARTIDACSPWTAGHSERVTAMALIVGAEMGLSRQKLSVLRRGGLLHDIGKIGIDPAILNKDGSLTKAESIIMQSHTTVGADILAPIPQYKSIVPIVLYHHERLDGLGYPDGLGGSDIPFLARIVAVADVYDALTTARPYRPALEQTVVIQEIQRQSGKHFDPTVVEAFLETSLGGRGPRSDVIDFKFDPEAFYTCID